MDEDRNNESEKEEDMFSLNPDERKVTN